jgi:hypothetical protein
MWFNKEESLFSVFEKVVKQYSFASDYEASEHDRDKFFNKEYGRLIEFLESGNEPTIDDISQDSSDFPFALNIVNQDTGYYAPPCRNCQNKCKNCPMPIS